MVVLYFSRSSRQTGKFPSYFPLVMLYRQIVDGKRAHCTFLMPTSLRTSRGAPPRIGMAKMAEGVSGLASFGVEIYKISEPSGLSLGRYIWSGPATTLSANDSSIACLKISGVPFRSDMNKTDLLSGVQEDGKSSRFPPASVACLQAIVFHLSTGFRCKHGIANFPSRTPAAYRLRWQ